LATYVRRERMTVNFEYWRLRAEVEQTQQMFAARKAIHQGDVAIADNRPVDARKYYEEGFQGWRRVLDNPRFSALKEDQETGEDLLDAIRRYYRALKQLDLPLPKPFVLQEIIDKYGKKAR
jgi:hypothetical protein